MSTLEQATKEYVTKLLPNHKEAVFYFHDLRHTKRVVKAVKAIGEATGLSKKQIETTMIAAWFHDVGYLNGKDNYAEYSVTSARQFLQEQQMSPDRIHMVEAAIRTVHSGQPQTLLEQVLYDADNAYLGGDTFLADTESRRKEHNHFAVEAVKPDVWWQKTLDQLQTHTFLTDYARRHYTQPMGRNAEKLEKKLSRHHSEASKVVQMDEQLLENERAKGAKPRRGVETLFRTTLHNHIELSKIADNKAHLMIQVNSIIISLIVSVLLHRLEDYPNLILPTAVLVVVSLVTIVFAILATRPQVSTGTFSVEEIRGKSKNLLYFGNFHQMDLADYERGMDMILADDHLLYSSMIHDLYYLGRVLGSKYRYIRIAYTVFMFGLSFAIMCFATALYLFPTVAK